MSKYTAEQVEAEADCLPNAYEDQAAKLRDYAALLRERESAQAAVTPESVEVACKVAASISGHRVWPDEYDATEQFECREVMRAVLEAVAPMLASARVPDGWVKHLSKPVTPEELKRAWNMIGQAHPQKEWVERALIGFIELRLAAAPKPETEE